jgi:hypothetical protein
LVVAQQLMRVAMFQLLAVSVLLAVIQCTVQLLVLVVKLVALRSANDTHKSVF